ncbi:hypothetical protein VTN49DRAFT_7838 [Thermomyces lanuginosus]|uniref:uncharacterized protein n=1 Tax=Thermomyces lanuginosus TaxID=5541 RepID=UPI003742D9A7
MRATTVLRSAGRTPLIKFLGKRTVPASVDHTPRAHPASPTQTLPDSFAAYRSKAQQHGPLNSPGRQSSLSYRPIGATPGAALGPVTPKPGEYFDRNELPERFRRMPWTEAEIEAVQTGGASLFN